MIVKKLKDSLEVKCPKKGFTSYRYLTKKDKMGFTLTKTVIPKGETQIWHYKNHLEACICIKGYGILTDLTTNKQYEITKDVMYALNKHDKHSFIADEETILICVFNPPLKGKEVHKEDGSYV